MIDCNVDPRDIPLEDAQMMMLNMFDKISYKAGAISMLPTQAILRIFEGRK